MKPLVITYSRLAGQPCSIPTSTVLDFTHTFEKTFLGRLGKPLPLLKKILKGRGILIRQSLRSLIVPVGTLRQRRSGGKQRTLLPPLVVATALRQFFGKSGLVAST